MRRHKVVIVGAGPAGGACALQLARHRGAEILLLDKSTYPRVKVCGSGLSPHGLHMLARMGLLERFERHHAEIRALSAKGPDGDGTRLAGGGKGAWVVPRAQLDNEIASEARRLGVEFREGTKVVELLRDDRGTVRGVRTTSESIEADLVICANGSPSRFSNEHRTGYPIRTIMGWYRGVAVPDDEAIMIWDRRLDGYYLWSFPEPDGITNIGLTIPQEAPHASRLKALFDELLDEHYGEALRGADRVGKWMGHPAAVTTKVGRVAEDRALWIGEAARLVSPGTVEGISFAMESGLQAASFIERQFEAAAGLSSIQQRMFRLATASRVLPKFWAAEAFVRLIRNRRARAVTHRLVNSRINQLIANGVVALLGEKRAA